MEREYTPRMKPLHFDQPAEFYVRRAWRRREKGELPEALQDLRTALKKDPDNGEILTDIGDLLGELGRYDQSNEWLLMHLQRGDMKTAFVYCLLGRNFLYLGEYDQARECLNLSLNLEPDEDTEYQAMGMLDTLEEQLAWIEEEETLPPALHLVGGQANPQDSEQLLFQAALQAQQGKIDDAIKSLDQRTRLIGEDMQGLCAKAVFCLRADRTQEGEKALQKAMATYPESPKEMLLLADTLGLLGRHREVLSVTEPMLEGGWGHFMLPQIAATAYYNLGNYKKAQQIFARMLLIDPEDETIRWYHAVCAKALAGEVEYPALPYRGTLPKREIYLMARKLQAIFSIDMTPEKLRENREFAQTIRWLLEVDADCDHQSLLHALYLIEGKDAEELFRRMLTRRRVPPRVKRMLLGYLQDMGAEGPYMMLLEEGVVEATPTGEKIELSDVQYRVEQLLLEKFADITEDEKERIQIIWRRMCAGADFLTRIRSAEPWAAALHCLLLQFGQYENPFSVKDVAAIYHVTAAAVYPRLAKLTAFVRDMEET